MLPAIFAASVVVSFGCHSDNVAAPHSSSTRTPAPCRGNVEPAVTVDQALAMREERDFVTVAGYLVRHLGSCTRMGCFWPPNCNSCELTLRIAASPKDLTRTIPLYSSRVYYTCSSSVPERCAFDADGQHVIVRGRLRIANSSVEPVFLEDAQICSQYSVHTHAAPSRLHETKQD